MEASDTSDTGIGDGAAPVRRRSLLRRLSGLVVRIVIAVLLLEGMFRVVLWWSQMQPPVVLDTTKGWRMAPSAVCRVEHEDGPYLLKLNSRGERDRLYPYSKEAERRRIVVLGGSNAFGIGVPQEDVFTEILERRLENVDVINLSCVHYDLDQQYLTLKEAGLLYHPDLVLQSLGETAGASLLTSQEPEMGLPKCWVEINQFDELSFHHPNFPWWLTWTRQSALFRVLDLKVFQEKSTSAETSENEGARSSAIRRLLIATRDLSIANGSDYLPVYMPVVPVESGFVQNILARLSEEEGLESMDLSGIHGNSDGESSTNPDLVSKHDTHFTEFAHYLIAEQIAIFLRDGSRLSQ